VIIDAKPKDQKLPTDAYYAIEEVHDDGTPTMKTFEHVGSEIGAEEAEEVGVEHLLRDIQDKTVGTLSQRISTQSHALDGLQRHMEQIEGYLEKVLAGKLPLNNAILYQLQDIFNLLPNLNLEEFTKAFAVKTNDQMLVIYVASVVRSVIALHNLIRNKVANREAEKQEDKQKSDDKKEDKKEEEKSGVSSSSDKKKGTTK
jgi:26S proteasome regulatory subunit N8